MLTRACWSSHVEVGLYDVEVLGWLAGYEPGACAVVAGMITRAYNAGQERGGGTR